MNHTLRLVITLALIAALAAALLGVMNSITEPIIEEGRRERLAVALSRVIEADEFEEVIIEEEEITYFEAYQNGDLVGYVFEIGAKGYGSQPIVMLVGLNTDVEVTGVEVLSHSETPGLGDRPFTEDNLEKFVGQGLAEGIEVDIVSGATASSLGVQAGVNEAVNILGRLLGLVSEIDFAIVPDGTYQGTGRGYGGDIDIEITIEKGELTDLTILNHSETLGISDPAFDEMPGRIIEEQNLEVDVVSGATATSNAIKEAIRNALSEFFGEEDELEPVVLSEVANGKYRGEADGLMGPIEIEVTVIDGVITSFEVLSHEESDGYAIGGYDAIPNMQERLIGSETLEVDLVTEATRTSEGIIAAIENALRGQPIIELSEVADGTYQGEASGFSGDPIVVKITVEEGVITSLDVLSHNDSPGYAEDGIDGVKVQLVDSDNLEVDTKTEATGTSEGVLQAVKNALSKGLQ